MATIFWPQALPCSLLEQGFSKQPQSNVIRTAMDAGPKKARRRYTATTVNVFGKQVFDDTELMIFEQFYRTALADGVLRFMFIDPLSGERAQFRFTSDYTVSAIENHFEVAMQLERL